MKSKILLLAFIAVFALSAGIGLRAYALDVPTNIAQAEKAKPKETKDAKKKVTPIIDPNDPSSIIYLDTSGKLAGTGDPQKPAGEAFKAGMAWHPQALSAEGLPKDKFGLIDWVKMVKTNIINPRHSLDPTAEEMPPLDMDVVIQSKGFFVNDVTYPHSTHTYWFNCEVCHPQIFMPAAGTNNMSMVAIRDGQFCGRCHGKVAFPLTDCARCHNTPKAKKK